MSSVSALPPALAALKAAAEHCKSRYVVGFAVAVSEENLARLALAAVAEAEREIKARDEKIEALLRVVEEKARQLIGDAGSKISEQERELERLQQLCAEAEPFVKRTGLDGELAAHLRAAAQGEPAPPATEAT